MLVFYPHERFSFDALEARAVALFSSTPHLLEGLKLFPFQRLIDEKGPIFSQFDPPPVLHSNPRELVACTEYLKRSGDDMREYRNRVTMLRTAEGSMRDQFKQFFVQIGAGGSDGTNNLDRFATLFSSAVELLDEKIRIMVPYQPKTNSCTPMENLNTPQAE